jgi:tetratricopeptide (TPR) repeat protein
MTARPELEIQGNFLTHPFAELLAEIAAGRLFGSLRISEKEKKCVVYFKAGRVVFAVSNARSARLFELLLRRGKLTKAELTTIPNFASDQELVAGLIQKGLITREEADRLFAEQIESIIVDLLSWPSGQWAFTSLARIRDGLEYPVDTTRLLLDYGRCMNAEKVLGRFRSLDETFSRSDADSVALALRPEEAFVLSRADNDVLSAASLTVLSAMSESEALQAIYTLWLSGLLIRKDWQSAFSAEAVTAMRNARLELKREALIPNVVTPPAVTDDPATEKTEVPPAEPEIELTVEEYLERVENSQTYYDVLGIDPKADAAEIKKVYFRLARMFHPDRYHSAGGEILRRVQNAFTELAQAHETLRSDESRQLYDYRMRKEIADRQKREAQGSVGSLSLQAQQAAESFDHGFSLLMDDDAENALPFLARAVHYSPRNARYHAYYGKALSYDETQRHKAEAEMQAALKLDPNNPTFRLLLAEFFIQMKLLKRAEGELNRLLAIFPSNREARDMLASLKNG